MPEARCGSCEFDGNLRRASKFPLHVDHAALLLFPGGRVLHEQFLPWRYHVRQSHQRTVCTDDKSFCICIELWAFPRGPAYDNRNAQLNPLAAPLLRPLFWITALLIVHGYRVECTKGTRVANKRIRPKKNICSPLALPQRNYFCSYLFDELLRQGRITFLSTNLLPFRENPSQEVHKGSGAL